ncbi:hypothetical protein HCN44_009536 [Aphidius gifuensis]|uniref:Uncharacterized protein n=1 Tax=Aphidius gifuensis TaxID=684658 RepID=A0A834Y6P9_APHGI|nr:hypothetical protein HCN44_009536 [Aphidius gifuensis]
MATLKCHNGTFYQDLRNDELKGESSLVECSQTSTDVCVRTELKVEGNFILYDYTCEDFIEPLEDLTPYHNIEDGCFDDASTSQTVGYYETIMKKHDYLRNLYTKNVGDYGIRMKICPCNNNDECNFIHKKKSFFDIIF